MKKILNFIPIFLVVLLFSGCSFFGDPASNGTSTDIDAAPKTGTIWKSTDSGKTWNALLDETLDISKAQVLSIAVNPSDANNVLVGLKGEGILKTTNGGSSWSYLKLQAEKIYGLALDPQNTDTLYASGIWQKRGKIWKSLDQGENWQEIYTAPAEGPLVVSLVLDVKNSQIVYISTSDNQVLRSQDGGATWSKIFEPRDVITRIATDKNNASLVYLLSENGNFYNSQDGGINFIDMNKEIQDSLKASGQFGEMDIDQNGWIYLGGGSLARSKDGGKTWENIPIINDTENFPIRSLAINPQNSNEIIYGSAKASYLSTNAGESWTTSQFNVSNVVRALKYSPSSPSIIYLGVGSLN